VKNNFLGNYGGVYIRKYSLDSSRPSSVRATIADSDMNNQNN